LFTNKPTHEQTTASQKYEPGEEDQKVVSDWIEVPTEKSPFTRSQIAAARLEMTILKRLGRDVPAEVSYMASSGYEYSIYLINEAKTVEGKIKAARFVTSEYEQNNQPVPRQIRNLAEKRLP
jgi:hypothetical protein